MGDRAKKIRDLSELPFRNFPIGGDRSGSELSERTLMFVEISFVKERDVVNAYMNGRQEEEGSRMAMTPLIDVWW